MPEWYVTRLDYDRSHLSIAIVRQPLKVVGGITYRSSNLRRFAEIVLCAASSDHQTKGYGTHMTSYLKDYMKGSSDIIHLLTFAGNLGVKYFKK